MKLTTDLIFSIRNGPKLPLPPKIQEIISKLRLNPAPYTKPKPAFTKPYKSNASQSDNWRASKLLEFKKIVKNDDVDYNLILSIVNKMAPENVERLSVEAIERLQKRDEEFRLSVSTLLFDRAITAPTISETAAELACIINNAIPEFSEDLQAQISIFPTLYDMTETHTFPLGDVGPQDERLVQWTKQKDKRTGYARFMMALFSKDLIEDSIPKNALEHMILELNSIIRLPKTPLIEENVQQFAVFLFEASSKVKGELKEYLKLKIKEILDIPKAEIPSLIMRSKFKLQDALDKLNKEEQK